MMFVIPWTETDILKTSLIVQQDNLKESWKANLRKDTLAPLLIIHFLGGLEENAFLFHLLGMAVFLHM